MKNNSEHADIINKTKLTYNYQFENFGVSPKGVFWQSILTQESRFKTLIKAINKKDQEGSTTITDFGCGYGALYNFIKDKPFMKHSSYKGYDIVPSMIKKAKDNFPNIDFIISEKILYPAEYTFISGTFNMAFNYSIAEWENYTINQIKNCYKMTQKTLAFNLLFASKTKIENNLFYTSADRISSICKENFGESIIVKTPGAQKDLTVFISR